MIVAAQIFALRLCRSPLGSAFFGDIVTERALAGFSPTDIVNLCSARFGCPEGFPAPDGIGEQIEEAINSLVIMQPNEVLAPASLQDETHRAGALVGRVVVDAEGLKLLDHCIVWVQLPRARNAGNDERHKRCHRDLVPDTQPIETLEPWCPPLP
jgi:hypothetical protein